MSFPAPQMQGGALVRCFNLALRDVYPHNFGGALTPFSLADSWVSSLGDRESLVPFRGVYSCPPPVVSCRFKASRRSEGRKSLVMGFAPLLDRAPEDSMSGSRHLFPLAPVLSSMLVTSREDEKTSKASDVGGGGGGGSRFSDIADVAMLRTIDLSVSLVLAL